MIKNILVPIDGSDHSKKALDFACQLGDKQGTTLHLLHIPQSPPQNRVLVLGGTSIAIAASQEELEKAGKKVMGSAEEVARECGFEKVASQIAGGDPAKRIIDYASENKIDMIVMGSRGLSDLSGLLVGSVSHKVNHLAPCTCVTVR